MRFSEDYFYEKYRMLPKGIKRTMYSLDIHDIVKSITDKYKLHIVTAGILDDEIMYAIIGITKVSDFIRNLKTQLKLPDEKVNAIAKDVNEKIFLPIRESLKKTENIPPVEPTNDSTKRQAITQNQESKKMQTQKEIHHSPLTESEEIKKQIRQQQTPKQVGTLPPNLPTGVPNSKEESAEQSNDEDDASPRLKNKKPSHIDPYREPIE
tara:strand:- start:19 stop:645 length:627 start_codon:yes stop_codon:yes gene_type:complete